MMNIKSLLFISLTLVLLQGCVKFQEHRAYYSKSKENLEVFSLTVPNGEWFTNPHGMVLSEQLQSYKLHIPSNKSVIKHPNFVLFFMAPETNNAEVVQISSGQVVYKETDEGCVIVVDILPVNKQHLIVNETYNLKRCNLP